MHAYAVKQPMNWISFALLALYAAAASAADQSIHVGMMESTVKIVGDRSLGTGFLIGKPIPGQPTLAQTVLVTAEHVLTNWLRDAA